MRNFDFRAWARRRSTRAFATAALILGPIAAVPVVMATGATAGGTGAAHGSVTSSSATIGATDTASSTGTASSTDTASSTATSGATDTASPAPTSPATTPTSPAAAKSPAADPANCGIGSGAFSYALDGPKGTANVTVTDPACGGIEFSLVSYSLKSPGVSFPQTRTDLTTVTASSADKTVTLSVTVPVCYAQVDLILGHDAPATLTTWYFSTNHTLLDAKDFTKGSCTITTTTPPPSTTTPPPSTTTPPPSTTTPPPSTTTPPPSTTTPPPPSCPPGTSSSTPPPGGSTPPPSNTCEPPCTGSNLPASCFSTPVLGFSTSQPPVYYSGGPSLPYTGANVPLRAGLLSALGLLCGGAALILLAGRTAVVAGHRRR